MCLHIHCICSVCTRCYIDKNPVSFQLDAGKKMVTEGMQSFKVMRPTLVHVKLAIGLPSSTVA